jgi:thioredoxin 1
MSDPELERILKEKAKSIKKIGKEMNMEAKKPLSLTSDNFDKTVNSDKPVIVDFWAEWCGPCRIMIPVFEKLAEKYGDKMTFARLNVDDNSNIASKYQVFSIPTFMVFMKGKSVDMVIGAVGEKGLEKLITKHTGS